MPESPLAKKMKIKPGMRLALIGAPDGYLKELEPLPEGVSLSQKLDGSFDWVQIFMRTQAELESVVAKIPAALKPDSLLWLSFPKGTSKVQTDLTRDKGWEPLHGLDLKWINLISVNETWSAFAMRPYKPGEARQTFRL